MKNNALPIRLQTIKSATVMGTLSLVLAGAALESHAATPTFASTSDAASWQVATNVGGADGQFSSFPVSGFTAAAALVSRPDWIANNASGSNGGVGNWTFFVFRQTFDLTGYDPATATLQFQWAADDSGEGFASRGKWTPKYSLNGGPLVQGSWSTGATYDYGLVTTLSSGFVSGANTLDFYVEGNGQTDGMSLKTLGFTAAVPEPSSLAMLAAGLAALGLSRRGRRRSI